MKTQNLNKYGLEFAGRRLTKRRLGCWLWVMVAAIVLALGVSAARAETGRFAPLSLEGRGGEVVLHAGFGVPNWVAFGVVTTLVLAVIGRLAWGWCVERDERSTYSDERWGDDGDAHDPMVVGGNEIPPSGLIPGTVMKPAKHGFVMDLQDGARRAHVRVFEFEVQEFTPGNAAEMPVSIDEPQAITRLRQAMELMREGMVDRLKPGLQTLSATPSTDSKGGAGV